MAFNEQWLHGYTEEGSETSQIDTTQYNVRKYAALIPVSAELLHDEYTPGAPYSAPVYPWYTRVRRWLSQSVIRTRVRLARWIAGEYMECDHDDW